MFLSLLQGLLGIVTPDAILLVRTSRTIVARIHCILNHVSAPALSFFRTFAFYLFSIGTEITVSCRIIGHVFSAPDCVLERMLLGNLVVIRLNEGNHSVFQEILVIFLAFIPRIGHYLTVVASQMFPQIFQEGNQCFHISGPGALSRPHYIFRIHSKLDVVAWLQLPIQHGIFFHPHESGIVVCLCVAVAVPTDVQFCFVILQPGDIPLGVCKIFCVNAKASCSKLIYNPY